METDKKLLTDRIIELAFQIPAPNPITPQLVQIAQALAREALAGRETIMNPGWLVTHAYGLSFEQCQRIISAARSAAGEPK